MESESTNFFDRFKRRPLSKEHRTLSQADTLADDDEDEEEKNFGSLNAALCFDKDMDMGKAPSGARSKSAPEIPSLNYGQSRGPGSSQVPMFDSASQGIVKSKMASGDPLGLNPIALPLTPVADIIFIHGLGGSSLRTWSWNRDTRKAWPQWLSDETELSAARIWTYGYSGPINGASSSLSIQDFAKDLLFKLKMEAPRGMPIGRLPIILVTHSMGGLVAKKAYLSGRQNDDYSDLTSNVKAMIFFSTPHRGGVGADNLCQLLRVVGMSKEYIKELMPSSTFLESINEEFAQACNDLQLFSFYESQKTRTPTGCQYIVDKVSGILHLPNEISKPMSADHHSICKFETRGDSGYKDIRNVLTRLLSPYATDVQSRRPLDVATDLSKLADLLSIDEAALDENLNRLLSTAKAGTCQWIVKRDWFSSWLQDDDDDPHVLWISGSLAAGKSVLAAYIVYMIRERWGYDACQYHAFDFSDKPRRSASYLLRSFAYQIAHGLSILRLELQRIVEQFGVAFSKMNTTTLWEKIFRGALFNKVVGRTLYWVIDGLDEAEPEAIPLIFNCLKTLSYLRTLNSGTKIKILLVSRETTDIAMRVAQLSPVRTTIHQISTADTYHDIRGYVEDTIGSAIPEGVASRQRMIDKVLKKASGNFLWVTLAIRDLEQGWYRQSAIENALGGFPGEMAPRYDRMMKKIEDHPENMKKMATTFLIWATYCFRPLQLTELKAAVATEFPDLTSLKDTIRSICGDFVHLSGAKLTLVHETARHYLINNYPKNFETLQAADAHRYIAEVCLNYLSSSKDRHWRQFLNMAEMHGSWDRPSALSSAPDIRETWPFLTYAATSWAYHLSLADPLSESLLTLVLGFFNRDALTWINTLALFGDLKSLIKAAQYLRAYLKNRERAFGEKMHQSSKDERTETLRLWAIDLIRVVGKFGSNLIQHPSSIYKLIPPFCPDSSMLGRASVQSTFSVAGVSVTDWDDCHARLSVGTEVSGRKVIATSEVFAALVPGAQSLIVWHAETCEEIRRLNHGEYVTEVAVNRKGDMVCTAGHKTIKVWELSTGLEIGVLKKHSDDRILAVGFGTQDDQVLVGYQDHLIVCQNWRTKVIQYDFHAVFKDETNVHNGLRVVSFSPDGIKLVVGSRNRPVDLWDLSTQSRVARCVMRDEVANADDDVFLQPEVIQWHPTSGSIYILYHNTALIDWNPVYDEKTEHRIGAKGMACSPCGNYLLTYEAGGSVKVFKLSDYSQSQQSELRLIYHLEHPDHVRDIAFSPDGHRFYDLRDSICSVWEPEVLVPPDNPDKEEGRSPSWDGTWTPVTLRAAAGSDFAPVTAIACAPNDLGFCSGHDDGTILVHEMTTGAKIRNLPGHAPDMAIIGLTWSVSGRWIASADDSGRVLVRKVQMPTSANQKMTVYKPSDFRISSDGVNQLLFSSNDRCLLVSTLSADRIWDLQEKRICHVREHTSPRRIKWIEHPSDPSRLVSLDAGEVHIFNWNDFVDLTPGDGLRFVRTDQNSITGKRKLAGTISDSVERLELGTNVAAATTGCLEVHSITQANDKRSIILETLPRGGYDRDRIKRRRIEFISTRDLSPHMVSGELVLQLSDPELTREVLKLVGSYQNRLVFFNQQHWLCTWEVGTAVSTYKRHLFLPKDWVSSETLQLNVLSDHGTLLCPRNGNVAIINNGVKF